MSIPVQMPLDYSMIALAEAGPHPEIVADIFPWEVFGELEGSYEEAEGPAKGGVFRPFFPGPGIQDLRG